RSRIRPVQRRSGVGARPPRPRRRGDRRRPQWPGRRRRGPAPDRPVPPPRDRQQHVQLVGRVALGEPGQDRGCAGALVRGRGARSVGSAPRRLGEAMSSAAPPLTVLLPVYNAARWVADAIASLLDQSFGDFELLAIDDGSTDRSLDVVRTFSDSRIRIVRNDRNRGLIETLNAGIAIARGNLLARMDADDLSHPDRFAVQVEYLDAHPDVAGVSCAYDLIDERGAPIPSDWGLYRPTAPIALRWAPTFGCFFPPSGAVLRTPVLRECKGFDARYLHAEDYELWLRLAHEHPLANVPQVLLTRREHGGNVSTRYRDLQWHNAYRALQASLRRVLGREIPLDL